MYGFFDKPLWRRTKKTVDMWCRFAARYGLDWSSKSYLGKKGMWLRLLLWLRYYWYWTIRNRTQSCVFMENSMWSNNNEFIIEKISYGYWIYQLTRNLHIDNVWEMHVIFQTAYYVGCVILTPLSRIPENINIFILLSPIACIWKPHSCPARSLHSRPFYIYHRDKLSKERKKKKTSVWQHWKVGLVTVWKGKRASRHKLHQKP